MYEAIDGTKIGKKINELRMKHGITETEMAKEIGISQSAMTMYECGKRIPRDEIKIKIASFFGLSVESIFYPRKQHEP